jgi:hypothetical protein
MDMAKQLLKEQSKANCRLIVNYVGTNKNRFEELISIYLAGPYRLTQRAAWPISYCVEAHPQLVKPHLKKIIKFAGQPSANVAVKRNTMRLLQFIDIPKPLHEQVAKLGFQFLADKKETVAVQVFAMTVLYNLSKEIPEFKNELKILIEDQLPYAKPAFKSRALKTLRNL